MCQWLGLSILMGVIRKSDTKDYWSTDPLIATPYFGSIMSRNRYLEIARFLHLSDNSVELPPDTSAHKVRLKKLGSLVECVNASFQAAHVPGEFVSLDEIMVPFKGRTYLKQYMPKKPIKWGIKIWGLADPTNGYVCNLDVYTGKDEEHDDWKLGLGGNVVCALVSQAGYTHTNRSIVADNFFTSVGLAVRLRMLGCYMVGTTQTNRKFFSGDTTRNEKGQTRRLEGGRDQGSVSS